MRATTTKRTLGKTDIPILAGMRIFHNYVRPQMALEGKTPAEVAGITVDGESKWLSLIQNAWLTRSNIKKMPERMETSPTG